MRPLLKKKVLKLPKYGLHEGYVFVGASTVGGRSSIYIICSSKKGGSKNGKMDEKGPSCTGEIY